MTPELTQEQLLAGRARAGRQNGRPLLTAEDAAAWLRETGLCLFVPRPDAVQAPAPSFAEAVEGRAGAPAATLQALAPPRRLLARLCAAGDAVPLHLLPHRPGAETDQPDFLATEETFPFLFALRGDREWRRGPRGRSTPLAVEVWKQLEGSPQTASALQATLGRHLTEAAVLRALGELWAELRIEPVYTEEGETRWQRIDVRREQALAAGAAMGQGTALSALVSVYLQATVAATGDEIERFLSPLASRSRVRDAVRGLLATRQLSVRPLGADEHFYVEGSLPEFPELGGTAAVVAPDLLPEVDAPADLVIAGEGGASFRIEALPDGPDLVGEGRKRYTAARGPSTYSSPSRDAGSRPERKTYGGAPKPFPRGDREGGPGGRRTPFFAREPWKEDRPRTGGPSKPPFRDNDRNTPYGAGENARPSFPKRPAASGDRRPFAPAGERKPFGEGRKPFGEGRKPFGPGGGKPFRTGKPFGAGESGATPTRNRFGGGEGRPFGGDREGFRPRQEGGREGFGERKPFRERPADRPNDRPNNRPNDRPDADRRPFGDARPKPPFNKRPFGTAPESRSFRPRDDGRTFGNEGDRKPFGERPSRPPGRGEDAPAGRREAFGGDRRPAPFQQGGKPFRGKPDSGFGSPKPFRGKTDGGFSSPKPFRNRPDGDFGASRPFRPRREEESGPTFRQSGRPGEDGPARSTPGGPRPPRPGARPPAPGGKRPRTAPFTSSGKPRPGVGATGRPGPRAGRPGAGPGGKPGARPFNAGGPRKGPGKGKPPRRDA